MFRLVNFAIIAIEPHPLDAVGYPLISTNKESNQENQLTGMTHPHPRFVPGNVPVARPTSSVLSAQEVLWGERESQNSCARSSEEAAPASHCQPQVVWNSSLTGLEPSSRYHPQPPSAANTSPDATASRPVNLMRKGSYIMDYASTSSADMYSTDSQLSGYINQQWVPSTATSSAPGSLGEQSGYSLHSLSSPNNGYHYNSFISTRNDMIVGRSSPKGYSHSEAGVFSSPERQNYVSSSPVNVPSGQHLHTSHIASRSPSHNTRAAASNSDSALASWNCFEPPISSPQSQSSQVNLSVSQDPAHGAFYETTQCLGGAIPSPPTPDSGQWMTPSTTSQDTSLSSKPLRASTVPTFLGRGHSSAIMPRQERRRSLNPYPYRVQEQPQTNEINNQIQSHTNDDDRRPNQAAKVSSFYQAPPSFEASCHTIDFSSSMSSSANPSTAAPSFHTPPQHQIISVSPSTVPVMDIPFGPGRKGRMVGRIIHLDADKRPFLACNFCRYRKIACGAGPVDKHGNPLPGPKRCNQCFRRGIECEYPSETRRGLRKGKPSRKILYDERGDVVSFIAIEEEKGPPEKDLEAAPIEIGTSIPLDPSPGGWSIPRSWSPSPHTSATDNSHNSPLHLTLRESICDEPYPSKSHGPDAR